MEKKEDEKELLQLLSAELKKDPVKAVLVDMTPLGLVEITRKKVRRSIYEQLAGFTVTEATAEGAACGMPSKEVGS